MKNILLAVLLLNTFSGLCQNVSVKKDVVYKDEQPYCKLVKTSSLIPRFSVRNMEDEELVVAKFSNEEQRYTVTFLGSGQVCYMQGTMGFGKIFAKDLVASNVIVDGKISAAGERRFLLEHGAGIISSGGSNNTPSTSTGEDNSDRYWPVERDRTKLLMVFGKSISQDNKTVGSYSVSQTTANGQPIKVFSFTLPNGEKIADAYVEGINAKSARLVILKNNQVKNVPLKIFDDMGMAEEIAEYLVYLYLL